MSRPGEIEVAIDELVLHGFAPAEAAAVQRGLVRGLERRARAAAAQTSWQSVQVPELPTEMLTVDPALSPDAIGALLADHIWERIDGA